MLTVDHLYVAYQKDCPVLDHLSVSLEKGKVHGIVGLNGAGKTTLLNTIYGFVRPLEGRVLYEEAPCRRSSLAFLEAENYFYPNMTGEEYLALFPNRNGTFDSEVFNRLFPLPLHEEIENYSTGMRKRLAILAVLKLDKEILILDEPFNGLDLETSHLFSLLIELLRKKGKTILITSHIYETLTACCDWIHYLEKGKIEHSYMPEEYPCLRDKLHQTIEKKAKELLECL